MKKKVVTIIISVIVVLAVIVLCWYSYEFLTKESEESPSIKEKISNEPIFTLNDYPRVDASLATQPLTNVLLKILWEKI